MNDIYNIWNGEKIQFTLRKLCGILEMEIPESIKKRDIDKPIDVITYNDFLKPVDLSKNNTVIFDVWPSKKNYEKYVKYIKEGVVIFSSLTYKDIAGNVLPTVKVGRGIDAWYKIGKYVKNIFDLPTIAITGSVGKTTTTLFAENVFSEKYKVFVSGNNRNTAVEIIRQMIERYDPSYQLHIQEAGGGRSKLVEESASLLFSDAFGITKISKHHHIDAYKDSDDIVNDKTSFDRYSKDDAFGVINIDDEVLREYKFQHEMVTYGIENPKAEYRAKDIVQQGMYLTFKVLYRDKKVPIKVNIVGKHNVYNALMVFALAKKFGLSDSEIQSGFLKYTSGAIRQSVREVSGRILYVDCFNVCSDSIKSCIDTLSEFNIKPGNRKIAVIGGENALGDASYSVNYETGTKIKPNDIDEFIFVGPKEPATDTELNFYGNGKAVYEGAKTVIDDSKIMFTDSLELVAGKLREETKPGDVILFKGIFRLPLFAAIDMAFATSYLIYNPNFKKERISENGFKGGYCKEISGTNLLKGETVGETLIIPDTIEDRPVFRIGKGIFQKNKTIQNIDFGKSVRNIGGEAFKQCTGIKNLVIPSNVIHIEEGAFWDCENLEKVVFEGVEHIEKNAFKGCKKLKLVEFKDDSCHTIEEGAFDGCDKLKIVAPEDSKAGQYAKERNKKRIFRLRKG